ncbi:tRNA pseudouridine(38-40) synthase TruA [Arcticibacterium luteifluviistationis]|uniref:tRNA pseudouridine synthase A n=1 Tax=Arcticibacterium luteifluviistationis TaxID=1784714 RepID=A0A2Z4GBJ6_9BACT|nr:tRNA pseudouridine(38-40) synthase TruA [Arcticibacterium luteifluviistationis]AWV98420.1 tRNA pseudouridine(38-40) synthase TruA [Arcticibacterium luteifluviistationis]
MRYFFEISYLGTHYHGWQIQPREISIQECIEKGLAKILQTEIRINGSSRTDTGVHARQQYAHVEIEDLKMSIGDLTWKLNSYLPKDISINRIVAVSNEKHSRFDATDRKYIYRINLQKDPFCIENSLYFRKDLDVDKMNEVSKLLLNHSNFQCFSKVRTEVNNFICDIQKAEWILKGHNLEFHVKSNRFLRGMVRAIVGTLLDVGLGKVSQEDFQAILNSQDRRNAGSAAKAHGLTLEEVNYPENYFAE